MQTVNYVATLTQGTCDRLTRQFSPKGETALSGHVAAAGGTRLSAMPTLDSNHPAARRNRAARYALAPGACPKRSAALIDG